MTTIGVTQFKQQCLSLLDQLEPEGLIVTKRGEPVARVIPYGNHDSDLIGSLSRKISVRGDIFTTGVLWGTRMLNLDTHILIPLVTWDRNIRNSKIVPLAH